MTKDAGILVIMPQDLRQWVQEEADAIGIPAAAFVRMALLQRRRGDGHSMPVAAPDLGVGIAGPDEDDVDTQPADVDDIVSQRLAEAVAKGIPQRVQREDDEDEDGPRGPVRLLSQPKGTIVRNGVSIEARRYGG